MTTKTKTKFRNGDGLDAPHIQPAKSTSKTIRILGSTHTFIQRAAGWFFLDLANETYFILVLTLLPTLSIQGAMQWMH
ncbi:hypothetical protein JZU46_01295 [bacterium]|jgi:hypothetical protein|nr:hypothetical protein [bacterium]